MSTPELEAFLARLYTDPELRSAFLAEPSAVAAKAGLDAAQAEALSRIDSAGLQMASASFARKRAAYQQRKTLLQRLKRLFGRRA